MTHMHEAARGERAFSFITSGVYTSDQRIPSTDLSAAIGKALSMSFGEPQSIVSYVSPKFSTPLAYDLRNVYLAMSEEQRQDLRTHAPGLFNALILFLKALPERE